MPGGRILVRIGLLAVGIAIQIFMLQHTALDRDRVADASTAALNEPSVRTWISDAVTDQVHPAVGLDPQDTQRLAEALPNSPEFERGFQAAIGDLHDRVFAPQATQLLSSATQSKLSESFRSAATSLGIPGDETAGLSLPFDSVTLPNLSWMTTLSNFLAPVLGAIGAACLLIGFAVDRNPRRVARRIGWGLGVNALVPLIPFVIVPWIAERRATNPGTAAFAAIMHALGRDLILPAVLLAALGAALVIASAAIGSSASPSWRQSPDDLRPRNGQFR